MKFDLKNFFIERINKTKRSKKKTNNEITDGEILESEKLVRDFIKRMTNIFDLSKRYNRIKEIFIEMIIQIGLFEEFTKPTNSEENFNENYIFEKIEKSEKLVDRFIDSIEMIRIHGVGINESTKFVKDFMNIIETIIIKEFIKR